MKNNEITLLPSYWACVSGGKDSLYMLNLILHNLDKYPLDGVVHFELEIDYPFIKKVIDYMESECQKHGIRFYRIKPEQSWEELYKKYRFPTRQVRWCNSKYKLSAKRKLERFVKSKGFYAVWYIGYCADEKTRFAKRVDLQNVERYPLVEEGIDEKTIWEWAKNQKIFNNYYKTQKRCGCMFCPMSSFLNLSYLYKYYPKEFYFMISRIRETEEAWTITYGRKIAVRGRNYNADYIENIVKTKWLKKLELEENKYN